MGGSATAGNILQKICGYANIQVPIISWKDTGLPRLGVDIPLSYRNPLYIFISFSGNTRETLSGFSQDISGYAQAVVAGGGKLLEEAKKNGVPFATFDSKQFQPRQAYGLTLYGLLTVLRAVWPEVKIPDLSKTINPAQFEAEAKTVATNIQDSFPFIYTSSFESHIGQIFKISCNESGKLLATANVFPEINHNELSGFETHPKGASVIFITSKTEHEKIKKEIQIIKTILTEYKVPMQSIEIPGETPLETTCNAIVMAEWLGYHLAVSRGLNPLGINIVNRIKELTK
jgi:glucose/mannose-6-phosphate isomerase